MDRRQQASDGLFGDGNERSAETVSNRIFGNLSADDGREVIKPFSIDKIMADMRQPRRIVPLKVRDKWDGTPEVVGAILQRWIDLASEEWGQKIDVPAMLKVGADDIEELPSADEFPIAHGLFQVIALAGSIKRQGMVNAITIIERGRYHLIETGERRWLAHHLLRACFGNDFAKIKAKVVTGDVWMQAAENGSRSPLNAISMARQLALLIMDMYPAENFDELHELVLPGECDRVFYAQANRLRVRRGFGQRVREVTGLKSPAQVSQI